MITKLLSGKLSILVRPSTIMGLRMLFLVMVLAATALKLVIIPCDPGWGGVGG